jgi:transcriptional regulator with XRE-family HTH domain
MKPSRNNVRQLRLAKKLSKSELARRAGISPLTVAQVEKGMPARIATRRKILLGLGLKLSEGRRVFREK